MPSPQAVDGHGHELRHRVRDLTRVEDLYREATPSEVHDVPQVDGDIPPARNLENPVRAVVSARRRFEDPLGHVVDEQQRLDAAGEVRRRDEAERPAPDEALAEHLRPVDGLDHPLCQGGRRARRRGTRS